MTVKTDVLLAGDLDRLKDFTSLVSRTKAVFFDVETVGDHRLIPALNRVTWIGLATKRARVVVPMGHPIGTKVTGYHKEPRTDRTGKTKLFTVPDYEPPPPQLSRADVFGVLEGMFLDPSVTKSAHNLPFDVPSVTKYLPEMPVGPFEDTQTNDWLINENRVGRYGLKDICRRRWGVDWDKENVGKKVEKFPFDTVAHYSYCDVHYGWLLLAAQAVELQREYGTDWRPVQLERDLLPVLCRMKLEGVPVDEKRLLKLRDDLSAKMVGIEGRVYQAAGKEFNLNSSIQRQEVLYGPKRAGGQGLHGWKLTDGAKARRDAGGRPDHTWYSTDDEALAAHPSNPVCQSLREYGDVNKLLGTYVLGWLGDGDKRPCLIIDGKIYTSFKPNGTVTGRFSSEKPNLQNIPSPDDDEYGNSTLIRGGVCAPEGWKLVTADYDQIELVLLAHYLGKGKLYDGFYKGIDPHIVTAMSILKKPASKVTKTERKKYGKVMNFAIDYGAGIGLIMTLTGFSKAETKGVLERHQEEFPEIYSYKRHVYRLARDRKPPHIRTLLGRKRRIPELNSREDWRRARAERQIFNSLIQGGSADLIKQAMINADRLIIERGLRSRLILTVHDELVALSPDEEAEEMAAVLVEAMTGPDIQKLVNVPLKTEPKIVQRWSQAK